MLKSPSLTTSVSSCNNGRGGSCSVYWRRRRKAPVLLQVSAASYQKFVDFAVNETKRHAVLAPSPLQEKYNTLVAMDGKTELKMSSFQAPKIRLLRSMSIQNEVMQVLDFAVFPKPEFDVPIFCANFFTAASTNIVVLDLNPLHDVIHHRDYKDKYYKSLMPLGLNYTKISCSFYPGEEDLQAWLKLMDQAVEETDVSQIMCNCEAQHRYLTWRAEKDPGHGVLKKLIGETLAADLLGNFLFNGIKELGSKKFLDYFPEYCCEDGTVNEKRSIIGKSFEHRPWDSGGEFVGDNLKVN
ncbi:Phytochromobilin:ferredoxin oxidoreductase [Citrus sinensis]|nr:Phytochromobilin:ferredoxin oxidoreductase [Citrus sinensis]